MKIKLNEINFGTSNIQGLATKRTEIFDELERFNLDIAILPKTKKKGRRLEEVRNSIHLFSGVNKNVRANK